MQEKVEISLDEFKEYINLKAREDLKSKQIEKFIFMSGIDYSRLYDLDLKQVSIDDSGKNYDEITCVFDLHKDKVKRTKI